MDRRKCNSQGLWDRRRIQHRSREPRRSSRLTFTQEFSESSPKVLSNLSWTAPTRSFLEFCLLHAAASTTSCLAQLTRAAASASSASCISRKAAHWALSRPSRLTSHSVVPSLPGIGLLLGPFFFCTVYCWERSRQPQQDLHWPSWAWRGTLPSTILLYSLSNRACRKDLLIHQVNLRDRVWKSNLLQLQNPSLDLGPPGQTVGSTLEKKTEEWNWPSYPGQTGRQTWKHELEYILIWMTRSRRVECGVVGEWWKDQQLEDAFD